MNRTEPSLNVNAVSRISEGTIIKGEITSPYDIRLDGQFEGKIISGGKIVVGESALIKGDLICANLDMYGKIEGNIYVKDILTLEEGCKVIGNLNTRRLEVELGSYFEGNCHMIDEAEFAALTGTAEPAADAE